MRGKGGSGVGGGGWNKKEVGPTKNPKLNKRGRLLFGNGTYVSKYY